MAKRQIVCSDSAPAFAVCIVNPDDTAGWLTGGGERGTDVKTYATKEAAERAIAQLKKNPHYSWSLPLEARAFGGFGRAKKE